MNIVFAFRSLLSISTLMSLMISIFPAWADQNGDEQSFISSPQQSVHFNNLEEVHKLEHYNQRFKKASLEDDFQAISDADDIGLGNDPLPSSHTTLLDYVLPSPAQHTGNTDAGSCLFMALTGAMEILMNKDYPREERVSEGQTDLSERWLMNRSAYSPYDSSWLVNNIYIYNNEGGALLNKDYRFTKGYYRLKYSVKVNWRNNMPSNWRTLLQKTPKVERKLLFGKRSLDSRFDVAVMSDKTVERIKRALVEFQGPVLIVYNNSEYWHAVLVVGYDDNASMDTKDKQCPYVKYNMQSLSSYHYNSVAVAMKQQGCNNQGVFYVRESGYYAPDFYQQLDQLYDYDLRNKGEEQNYVAPFVKREYEWVKYLANYAIAIYPTSK
ncbi:MAG: hypothetical protein HQK50_00825 [Oligoflexia bacterium]|nr:hypothetical protein [Oligoflexia bacterium]